MHTITTIRRYGAGLFTLGAVAALAAGCSAGPAPSADPAAGDSPAAPAEQEGQAPSGQGRSDVHDAAAPAEDDGGASSASAEAPGEWDGTVSTERFAPEVEGSYLAMMTLHGDPAIAEVSAEDIESSEFLAGADAQCESGAALDGDAASCTLTAMDGSGDQQFAQVRLVRAGFGNTALLFGVAGEAGASLAVAPGAAQGLQSLEGEDVSAVTDEELADAATSAVMRGFAHDGELPAELSVTCEVGDGGERGLCEVAGTPDGGGDGTWYASAQHGYDGDRAAYLFTQLPQG